MEILLPPNLLTMYSGRVRTWGKRVVGKELGKEVANLAGDEDWEEDEAEELEEDEGVEFKGGHSYSCSCSCSGQA